MTHTVRDLTSEPSSPNLIGVAAPLRVEGVSKRFRQGESVVEALRCASLRVEQAEFVAIMGASGSGKSTLLHVVAGLTSPDEGKVLVEGSDLGLMSDRELTRFRRRRIGMVFQAFNLIPTLTAEENILLPALADGASGPLDERLERLLNRLDIARRRRHRPDALSGGEQQRVAIARALIMEPALVLADEPTGSLDSISGQGICQLLSELCREQGRTIVVVTHEPTVAAWAERIVVVKDGCIRTGFDVPVRGDAPALMIRYQEAVNNSE